MTQADILTLLHYGRGHRSGQASRHIGAYDKRRVKAWHKAQFVSQLERGKYQKCTENTMGEVPNGTSTV